MSGGSNRTIDFYHKQRIDEFKQKLANIEQKLLMVDRKSKEKQKLLLDKEQCIQDQNEYYLKTMDLLTAYYEHSNFYGNLGRNNQNAPHHNNLSAFVRKTTTVDKTHLFNEYMYRLNNETKYKSLCYLEPDMEKFCKHCGGKRIVDTLKSSYICQECGHCSFVLLEPEKSTYIKHPVIETQTFSYRRYDHFVEWLNKFHNVEKSKVPKKVYTQIHKELNKLYHNHHNTNQYITKETITEILKKTGNSKYNCQVMQIMNVLNKKKLPTLPAKVQQTMKRMFKETLQLFSEICPNNRTNFLSYSYVIRKFLEILNEQEYIEYFPLLKSKEKLYQQDQIWKTICDKLKWKYYPTI